MADFCIILPVRNGSRFSPKAVQSILNQNVDVKILWISEHNPKDFGIQSHTVEWLYQKASGISAARNVGLDNADGKWLGFLDADDQYLNGALTNLSTHLLRNPTVDAVFGCTRYEFLEARWRKIYRPGKDDIVASPLLGAGLWRKDSAMKIGSFDRELETGEDVDWLNRAREMGLEMEALNTITLQKTIHGENLTLNSTQLNLDLLRVVHKSILRKRNAL